MDQPTYVLTPDCHVTADGWCSTHSTVNGPVYCEPMVVPE